MKFQILAKTAEDAVKLSRSVEKISIGDSSLQTTTVKLPDDTFSIQVYNFEKSADAESAVKAAVESSVPSAVASVRALLGAPKSAVLRFSPQTPEASAAIVSALEKVKLNR